MQLCTQVNKNYDTQHDYVTLNVILLKGTERYIATLSTNMLIREHRNSHAHPAHKEDVVAAHHTADISFL